MGGGGEGDAKNGEPLQASRREREEASREDGSQAGILSELRDAKGQREKQAGPFHGAGMGDKPQVAHGGQGAQEVPSVPPPPPQASKWRLAAAAARLCPGMGWGWRTGRTPNQMPPGWAQGLPASSADPTSSGPEPSHLELWGWREMGVQRWELGVQQTKLGPLKPWAGPQDPTKMAQPGTARETGWVKINWTRPEGAKLRGPGGSATPGHQLPQPHPQLRAAQLKAPSAHRVPVFIEKRPWPSCPRVLGRQPQVWITDDLRQQQQEAVRSRWMVQATRLSHIPLTSAPPRGEGRGPGRPHLSHGRATKLKVNTEPRGHQTTFAKNHGCPALPRALPVLVPP